MITSSTAACSLEHTMVAVPAQALGLRVTKLHSKDWYVLHHDYPGCASARLVMRTIGDATG